MTWSHCLSLSFDPGTSRTSVFLAACTAIPNSNGVFYVVAHGMCRHPIRTPPSTVLVLSCCILRTCRLEVGMWRTMTKHTSLGVCYSRVNSDNIALFILPPLGPLCGIKLEERADAKFKVGDVMTRPQLLRINSARRAHNLEVLARG